METGGTISDSASYLVNLNWEKHLKEEMNFVILNHLPFILI